jgi:hypothetical protein
LEDEASEMSIEEDFDTTDAAVTTERLNTSQLELDDDKDDVVPALAEQAALLGLDLGDVLDDDDLREILEGLAPH